MINLGLLENKKTPVQKPRILLRLDKNKRFKPSRLIFKLRKTQSLLSIKPLFVNEVRILRQYDCMNEVISQVFYTLCNNIANVQLFFEKSLLNQKISSKIDCQ